MKKANSRLFALACMALASFSILTVAHAYGQQGEQEREQAAIGPSIVLSEVQPGPGVTNIYLISDFDSSLAGTAFDTPVFELADEVAQAEGISHLDGTNHAKGQPSQPALFVCAGSHENEIAGILATYWLIEKSRVHGAKLFVMPRANAAGATWSMQNTQSPQMLQAIPGLSRIFRYGARLSNPAYETIADQLLFWPPEAPEGSQALPGQEMRNLNRQYPGSVDSSMTARLAFCILSLLKNENISIAVDMHEAGTSSKLGNMIMARNEFLDEAALAALDLEERANVSFRLEESKPEFAGYSHWEWGKLGIHAFLVETFNPAQPSDEPAVDQFNNAELPLGERVYVQLLALQALIARAETSLGLSVDIEGLPASVLEIEKWLAAPVPSMGP